MTPSTISSRRRSPGRPTTGVAWSCTSPGTDPGATVTHIVNTTRACPGPAPLRSTSAPWPFEIRLTRVGATKQPTYRLVVADSRSARDGRAIDTIGHYNPRTDPIELQIDEAKAKHWLSVGAQPSDTVKRLFKNAGITPAAK